MNFHSLASACRRATLASAALALLAVPAFSQDLRADDWSFNLFNDSTAPMVVFTTTDPAGVYGYNWLDAPMQPGIGLTMEFTDPLDTRCEILTRAELANGTVFEAVVDYCGTAIVQVTNAGIAYE